MIVDAISERFGSNTVLLDMADVSLLADFFVLTNAESTPQFQAIVDEVEKRARESGSRPLHVEGAPESGWVLVDFGSVVVHIFSPGLRAYYDLENLWKKARLVVRIQ